MNKKPLKYNKLMAVKITEDDFDLLEKCANYEQISISELVRQAIGEKIEVIFDQAREDALEEEMFSRCIV